MSRLYGDNHRALQEQFDSRRLADAIEKVAMETEVVGPHKDFIESRDMFFLSSVDHKGRPTVSYKGGDPGFRQGGRRHDSRVPQLRRQRHVPVHGEYQGQPEYRHAVHQFRGPAPAEVAGRGHTARRRPGHGPVQGSGFNRQGQGIGGLRQLPALRAQVPEGRPVQVCPPYRMRDTAGRLEAYRHDPGGVAGQRPGPRRDKRAAS